jgi:alkylhydroperoxidase/carboxymuconolactone decarboxylase family protein YurZ
MSDPWQALREADPEFFARFAELADVPRRSATLEPKVKELVCLAVNAAATHMYEPGIREHAHRAIELGATRSTVGVPLLLEALGEREAPPLDERRAALKADFEAKRGYWHEFWDGLLELDPDFFEAYVGFSAHPWEHGVLEPKVKELIYTAFDASATHMYVPGLRQHIENALGYGATPAEVMEVFELASTLGIHGYLAALPIVLEELEA